MVDSGDNQSHAVVLANDERTPPELIDVDREKRLIRCAHTLLGGAATDPDSALLALFQVVADSEDGDDSAYVATVKLDRVWAMRDAIHAANDLRETSVG